MDMIALVLVGWLHIETPWLEKSWLVTWTATDSIAEVLELSYETDAGKALWPSLPKDQNCTMMLSSAKTPVQIPREMTIFLGVPC